MAYLRKQDTVMITTPQGVISALVVDMQFRRFRRSWKDKKTGETRFKMKSVPYAICQVFSGAPAGTEFLIPGYKLRNITKAGEKLLVLRDQYTAEFNGEWVEKMLAESREGRAK